MNGDWDPSMWNLANELAGLGLQQGTQVSPNGVDRTKAPPSFSWAQAAGEPLGGQANQSYPSLPLDDSSAKGWGGQARLRLLCASILPMSYIMPEEMVL